MMAEPGHVSLIVNGGEPQPAKVGDTLLRALRARGVAIPTLCGGHAKCGKCKVKVISGGGGITEPETMLVSPELAAQGLRLSCQVVLREDVAVEVPAEFITAKSFLATVKEIQRLNYDTLRLVLAFGEGEKLDFKAGQFVELDLVLPGPEPVKRSYSISSPPQIADSVSLVIRKVPFGKATRYIHEELKPGDRLFVSGPFGDFFLSDNKKPAVFIAGGSGVSPFYGILEDMAKRGIAKKVSFFLCQNEPRDFYELDVLEGLCKATGSVELFPVACVVEAGESWPHGRGLVTDALKKHFSAMHGMEAYLCGSPGMIEACSEVLKKLGVREVDIHYDNFA